MRELRHLWRVDRTEFVTAMAAMLGVLGSGLLRGVLIGAIISLVQLLRRASRPHVALLGRIPGTRRFSDRQRHPDNELIPNVAIFRPESGLVYFNVEHVRETILERVRAQEDLAAFAAEARRQSATAITEATRDMVSFWSGGLAGAARPKAKKRR